MMAEEMTLPHKLSLNSREHLTMSGVTEVVRFDEETVVLKTSQGLLNVHGQGLQLKNLSLEGGQVAVEGTVDALIYETIRPASGLRRLFK